MLEQNNHPIKLSNPCPMLLSRMKESGDDYYCKSCTKVVVDYSKKSIEEIIANLKPGSCGIFNTVHVQPNPRMPFQRRFIFYMLTLLSFFGINVKPLKSQTVTPQKDTTTITFPFKYTTNSEKNKVEANDSNKVVKKEKKSLFRRKRKERHFRTLGCVDF